MEVLAAMIVILFWALPVLGVVALAWLIFWTVIEILS